MKTFTLEENEAEFVLHVIGQLPTQSGAYPLLQKLQQQAALITPQAAYTTALGNIAHSNPIVLNSAGRVPGGEIWLSIGVSYKFTIDDANNVLIGTYDNINGTGSGGQGYVTATQSQTVVTVPFAYVVGTNNLKVYVNGSKQVITLNYTETNTTSITFVSGLNVGDIVEFTQ